MSESPLSSRRRVVNIPIQIEGAEQEKSISKRNVKKSEDESSNDQTASTKTNNVFEPRKSETLHLPMYNVKEKIILIVDPAEDENYTPFIVDDIEEYKPFDILKQAVEMFLQHKSLIDKKHEYALVVLTESGAVLQENFTSNINKIINSLHTVHNCETEDIIELRPLFEIIEQKADVPRLLEIDETNIPPPFTVRAILFYGRSYTMPKLSESEKIKQLLKSPYFTFDVLMTHETVDANNNCNKIFNVLQNVDQKGFSYFFPVARDSQCLFSSVAKLLGHPLQRPVQKKANYSIGNA